MTDELIPADVQDFIFHHIHSIGQIEALLLLRGSPQEHWNLGAIARRLYTTEKVAADLLAQLCQAEFLHVGNGTYKYAPSPEDSRVIDRLASIYSRHLIPVTN